ncbi:E3 ubiquitin-protein ligase TRIM17 [Trichechus manatus latirostris]|uniref:RING-type E3 ubiquitin transferase n=1 Tax=Trichechus manatus latirostris TaxID=127582 RepID=A0A2Y9E2F3_TRIMA|nr:E3 ubiquitin-protein ligase TRIM17 [Trichechus manatus latirostris]
MDAVELTRKLQEEATCSICLDYFTDPVMTACGHNFCRECIQMSWEKGRRKKGRRKRRGSFPCPECREMSPQRNLRPNRLLTKVAEMARQHPGLQKRDLCQTHQELLKLFCQEDQSPICVICRESREHRPHTVFPIDEAIQDYKVKLEENIEYLREEMMKTEAALARQDRTVKEWQEEVKSRRDRIAMEFEKMCIFLAEEEKRLLQTLKKEEEETVEKLRENKAVLVQQSSSLEMLLLELEDKREHSALQMVQLHSHAQQPPSLLTRGAGQSLPQLLSSCGICWWGRWPGLGRWQPPSSWQQQRLHQQGSGTQGRHHQLPAVLLAPAYPFTRSPPGPGGHLSSTLYVSHADMNHRFDRIKSLKTQYPETLPTKLKTVCRVPGQIEVLKCFQVDVVPDAVTAYPYLLLYDSRQRCYLNCPLDSMLRGQDRFLAYPCVLGQTAFSAGRHYWEVGMNLTGDALWALGVCRDNISRKERVPKSPENGFWVVQLSKGKKYVPMFSDATPFTLMEPPSHVGIFLDYEAGDVSFYNVNDGSHLHTYSQATFSGPLQPFFCLGAPKSGQMVISTVTAWVKG